MSLDILFCDPHGVGGNTIWGQGGCMGKKNKMFIINMIRHFYKNCCNTEFAK